jgi:hypothetical protein
MLCASFKVVKIPWRASTMLVFDARWAFVIWRRVLCSCKRLTLSIANADRAVDVISENANAIRRIVQSANVHLMEQLGTFSSPLTNLLVSVIDNPDSRFDVTQQF